MDVRQANELLELAKSLVAETTKLRDALEWEFLAGQLVEVFTTDYDLGEVVRVEEITGGYVNLSFAIWADDGSGERRYFVRKYNRAITEREVRFEHALVSHINRKGFHMAAQVFPTKAGGTFVTREEILDGEPLARFFAVYEMLSGAGQVHVGQEPLHRPRARERRARAGRSSTTARTTSIRGGSPASSRPSWTCCASLPATFKECAGQATDTRCDEYFLAKLPAILDVIDKGVAIEPLLSGMPFIPVHCDFHPGNLKWVDQEAVAMRPWSGLGPRAPASSTSTGRSSTTASSTSASRLAYFCSSWEGTDSGELWLDKTALFVRAYQDEAAKHDEPGPMSAAELALLPRMIANGNLYVLNWDVTAYYEDKEARNDDEYLMYLEHQVKVMEFIESHIEELAEIAASAAVVAGPDPAGAQSPASPAPAGESEVSA